MTLNYLVSQVFDLSVGGYFNREKFTKKRLKSQISAWMQGGTNYIVMEIALPDGCWYFSISRFQDGEYGYFIPESREQENKLKRWLSNRDLLKEEVKNGGENL